jgi:hypothetical protein
MRAGLPYFDAAYPSRRIGRLALARQSAVKARQPVAAAIHQRGVGRRVVWFPGWPRYDASPPRPFPEFNGEVHIWLEPAVVDRLVRPPGEAFSHMIVRLAAESGCRSGVLKQLFGWQKQAPMPSRRHKG